VSRNLNSLSEVEVDQAVQSQTVATQDTQKGGAQRWVSDLAGTMQLKSGSATVSVAAISVPLMALANQTINCLVNESRARSGRRDADQCGRDATRSLFELH
jgi:hypothetical protein